MSDAKQIQGQCLCGSVKITAAQAEPHIGACHCDMCRRWTTSPMQTIGCGNQVSFQGEENIGIYSSSEWAERGFCKQCGSALFYRIKQNGNHFMAAGLFDNLDGFVFDHEVFIDEKPDFYSFSNDTRKMTGAEMFAHFTSQAD